MTPVVKEEALEAPQRRPRKRRVTLTGSAIDAGVPPVEALFHNAHATIHTHAHTPLACRLSLPTKAPPARKPPLGVLPLEANVLAGLKNKARYSYSSAQHLPAGYRCGDTVVLDRILWTGQPQRAGQDGEGESRGEEPAAPEYRICRAL